MRKKTRASSSGWDLRGEGHWDTSTRAMAPISSQWLQRVLSPQRGTTLSLAAAFVTDQERAFVTDRHHLGPHVFPSVKAFQELVLNAIPRSDWSIFCSHGTPSNPESIITNQNHLGPHAFPSVKAWQELVLNAIL